MFVWLPWEPQATDLFFNCNRTICCQNIILWHIFRNEYMDKNYTGKKKRERERDMAPT